MGCGTYVRQPIYYFIGIFILFSNKVYFAFSANSVITRSS